MCESNSINNLKLCYFTIMQWYSVKLVKMYLHAEPSSTESCACFFGPSEDMEIF